MNVFGAIVLSCCLLSAYGGAPPQDGSDGAGGPGEMTNANSQQNCMQKCTNQNKCTFGSGMGALDSRCRECIEEDCDAMSSSPEDNAICRFDAYSECDTCPVLNAEQQRNHRVCRTCLRKCSSRGRRPGRRPGRGSNMFRPVKTFFGTLRCMRSCQAPDNCPSRQEVRAQLFASRRECRECVMETCGPYDRSNRTDIEDCIVDARQDCSECPVRNQEQQMRTRSCKRCLRSCTPRRGNGPFRPGLVRRPFQRLSCIENCQSESTCPTFEEVTNQIENLLPVCRECISEQCGPFTSYNFSKVMGCVARARRGCIDCPITTVSQQMRMKRCRSCGKRCFRETFGGFGPGPFRPGPFRPGPFGPGPRRGPPMRPFERLSCLLSCQSPSQCPTKAALISRVRSTTGPCRECLEEECGEFESTSSNEIIECLPQARLNCDSCPVLTSEEQQNMRSCRSCVRGCRSMDNIPRGPRQGGPGQGGPEHGGPGRRGPGRGGPGRGRSRPGLASYFCLTDCVSPTSCPTRSEAMTNFQAVSQECRTCIMGYCGSFQESNRSQVADCINDAREECSECPTVSPEEQERSRTCKSCIRNCAPRKGPINRGSVRRGLRRGIFKTMTCMKGCQSPQKCPMLDEIRNRLMNTRQECKECVEEECGDFNRSNRSEVADCIAEAREDCEECPTLTDQDQRRRRGCMSCVRGCFPFRGGFPQRRRRFRKGPLKMLSCMRQCSSENRCPSRREFMRRFMETPKSCKLCVMNQCGQPGFNDEDGDDNMADCIDEAQEECSGCPDLSEEDQGRRRTCRSCVKMCLSRGDDCDRTSDRPQRPTRAPPSPTTSGLTPIEMCRQSCQSSPACMSTQSPMPTTLSSSGCLACIAQRGCNQYPAFQRPRCLIQARQSCPTCSSVPAPNRLRFNPCRICIARCSRASQGGGRTGSQRRPGQGRPGPGSRVPGGNTGNPYA